MCANCVSRSGCAPPSRVLRLPCRLYPKSRSVPATQAWLTRCPRAHNSAASLRTLLQVQRKGDCGSPRVTGSTRCSRSARTLGSRSTVFLRPPPGRRMRPGGALGTVPLSSLIPPSMVLRDNPVARATAVIPPHPRASASDAATARRPRSSSVPATRASRSLISSCAFIPPVYRRWLYLTTLFLYGSLVPALPYIRWLAQDV